MTYPPTCLIYLLALIALPLIVLEIVETWDFEGGAMRKQKPFKDPTFILKGKGNPFKQMRFNLHTVILRWNYETSSVGFGRRDKVKKEPRIPKLEDGLSEVRTGTIGKYDLFTYSSYILLENQLLHTNLIHSCKLL